MENWRGQLRLISTCSETQVATLGVWLFAKMNWVKCHSEIWTLRKTLVREHKCKALCRLQSVNRAFVGQMTLQCLPQLTFFPYRNVGWRNQWKNLTPGWVISYLSCKLPGKFHQVLICAKHSEVRPARSGKIVKENLFRGDTEATQQFLVFSLLIIRFI